MTSLFRFIYTGECELAVDEGGEADGKEGKEEKSPKIGSPMALQLMTAADRFGVHDLAEVCAELQSELNPSNAASLLALAA